MCVYVCIRMHEYTHTHLNSHCSSSLASLYLVCVLLPLSHPRLFGFGSVARSEHRFILGL